MLLLKLRSQMLPREKSHYRKFGLSLIMLLSLILSFAILSPAANADEANVVKVRAKETQEGVWRFNVTVRHKDKGWNHYANNWEVLSPEGDILAERVLAHPHVKEQPFTRSLSGVKIPEGITEVIIRARDSVHEYGGRTMRVNLQTGKASKVTSKTE